MSSSGLKNFFHACFYQLSCTNILSRDTKYCARKRLAILIWKWEGSFQVYDLVHDFWKSITRCTFLHCGARMHTKKSVSNFPIFLALKLPSYELAVFIDMNMYILKEGRNFKTFLKENYTITLDSCYSFTKKMLNMELNLILIALMEFANVRHSWNLQQIWWIPGNLSRLWIWQPVSL